MLNTVIAATQNIKYHNAELKIADVKVVGERTRTEETDKFKQLAEHIALTALQYI